MDLSDCDTLDTEGVEQAFELRGGRGVSFIPPAQVLIARGDVNAYIEEVPKQGLEFSVEELERHDRLEFTTSSETPVHREMKLTAIEYLKSHGFEIPTRATEQGSVYDCIEEPAGGFQADVFVEDKGGIVVEVGTCTPKRLFEGFGYANSQMCYDSSEELIDDVARVKEGKFDRFVSFPYSGLDGEIRRFYVFEKSSEMPSSGTPPTGGTASTTSPNTRPSARRSRRRRATTSPTTLRCHTSKRTTWCSSSRLAPVPARTTSTSSSTPTCHTWVRRGRRATE